MSLFGSDKDLVQMAARLEGQNELLKEENERLRTQVDTLQRALISKEAPRAFEDMRHKEAEIDSFRTPESIIEEQEESRYITEILNSFEEPLFKNPQDMIDKLSSMEGFNSTPNQLHANSES